MLANRCWNRTWIPSMTLSRPSCPHFSRRLLLFPFHFPICLHPLTLSLRPNRTPLAYSFPPTLLYTPNLYLIQWSSHTPSNLLPIQQAFHKLWVYPYHGNASNPWFPTYFWYAPYPRHKFNYRCHSHLIISALPQPNPFHHFFLSLIHPR